MASQNISLAFIIPTTLCVPLSPSLTHPHPHPHPPSHTHTPFLSCSYSFIESCFCCYWEVERQSGSMDSSTLPLAVPAAPPPCESASHHARDIWIMSFAFLFMFLAFSASQNLQSTLNTEENLGTVSLGVVYVSFSFFSLFASLAVRGLGSKNALILGSTGYWFFVASNLKPNWYTMIPASLYLGFCASVSWVGQGTYLTLAAKGHVIHSNLHEGTVIGMFNGVFFGMYASNQFVGNLISLAVLKNGKDGKASGTTLLFSMLLCSATFGIILMCFLNRRDNEEEKGLPDSSVSFTSYIVNVLKLSFYPLVDKRMLLILPLISYLGLQQAFAWAEYTKHVVHPALGASGVGGAMVIYGASDAVCALIAGRLTSSLSSAALIVSGGAIAQALVYLWLLFKYSLNTGILGMVYPLGMASLLGIGNGALNTQINASLGMLFKHNTASFFGQFKVWQSASIAVILFVSPYISFKALVVVMVAVLGMSLAVFWFLTLRVERALSTPASKSLLESHGQAC